MTKVALEYNYAKNTWRTSETTDLSTSEQLWTFVDECDKDVADSFIEKMIEVQPTPLVLKFTNMDNVKFLLKLHTDNFFADKKRKEYAAAGKDIKVLYN